MDVPRKHTARLPSNAILSSSAIHATRPTDTCSGFRVLLRRLGTRKPRMWRLYRNSRISVQNAHDQPSHGSAIRLSGVPKGQPCGGGT
jgi:hypothetical protein